VTNNAISVELLEAASSSDRGLVEQLTGVVNDGYATAESGLWRDGATRTTAYAGYFELRLSASRSPRFLPVWAIHADVR
jgi:hypothetical protein